MGIIGTVMGLVHVLGNLEDPSSLGPQIAVAFIATLYGVSTANLLYLPYANFNSNWELSAIRATNVTQLLINYSYIAPQRLAALGYGEFRPIVDNSTEAGRIKN